MPRLRPPRTALPRPPLRALAGGRPGRGSCSSRAATRALRRAGRVHPAPLRPTAACWGARPHVAPPAALPPRSCRWLVGGVRRGLLRLLDHPKLGRGIPEVRFFLAVDQIVDRGLGRLAL